MCSCCFAANAQDNRITDTNNDFVKLSNGEKVEGFILLFNGKNLDGWIGNKKGHFVENKTIAINPKLGRGNLYTENEFANFILRLEFKLTPGANNGLGIRAPLQGDAAYLGMELQVLDNTASRYAELEGYQYHGSVYGVIPAERGYVKPVGEWNEQEVIEMSKRLFKKYTALYDEFYTHNIKTNVNKQQAVDEGSNWVVENYKSLSKE